MTWGLERSLKESDIRSLSDEVITTIAAKYMGELVSVALPLAHIQESDLAPAPGGLTNQQKWVWRIIQLTKHPEADSFSRVQLLKFLKDIKGKVS